MSDIISDLHDLCTSINTTSVYSFKLFLNCPSSEGRLWPHKHQDSRPGVSSYQQYDLDQVPHVMLQCPQIQDGTNNSTYIRGPTEME